jgi:hypothetical protein
MDMVGEVNPKVDELEVEVEGEAERAVEVSKEEVVGAHVERSSHEVVRAEWAAEGAMTIIIITMIGCSGLEVVAQIGPTVGREEIGHLAVGDPWAGWEGMAGVEDIEVEVEGEKVR